jgi:hypothetical protein
MDPGVPAMNFPKIKKTKTYYLFEIRKTMGRILTISRQWCQAFDYGDHESVAILWELLGEELTKTQELTQTMSETEE